MTRSLLTTTLAILAARPCLAALPPRPDPIALSREAAAATNAGDHAKAAERFRAMAEGHPSLPSAKVALARSLARLGRHDEALTWLERAAAQGVGTDTAAVSAAFGSSAASPRLTAVLERFRTNVEPLVASRLAFPLAEKDLMPESVAFDPRTGTFYVGSLHKRKVVAVREGAVRDFVLPKADGMGAVLGLKVDLPRGILLVNTCHSDFRPVIVDAEPERKGRTALLAYDLATGRLVRRHDAGSAESPVCFNDLAVTGDGTVYLSSGASGVYRVAPGAREAEVFVETPGLIVNGIAVDPRGTTVYLADYARGVVRLDVASRELSEMTMPASATLAGIDGLYLHGQRLIGIQNGLAAGPERVVEAVLDATKTAVLCVRTLERSHPDYDVPTTGVIVGDSLVYVAGSLLNRVDEAGRPLPAEKLRESKVLRLPLGRSVKSC